MRSTKPVLGISLPVVCALALLGVPRVIAHDLDLVGPAWNAVLVFAPIAAWVGYVWWRRVTHPFRAVVAIGAAYGIATAITHQILWTAAFDVPPRLGGTLEGQLTPGIEAVLLRVMSIGSSVLTGVFVGSVAGAIARLLGRATDGRHTR